MALSFLALSAVIAASGVSPPSALRSLTVEGEVGPAYVFQNDNAYGSGGTKYTAREVGQQRNLFIGKRLAVEAQFGERHTVVVLYAPLDLTTRVTLPKDIVFKGELFREGEVVDHRYLFDGYRGSYLFRLINTERFQWHIGASLQIRNASVELRTVDESPSRFQAEYDIGTVVALKSRLVFRPRDSFWTMLEADGTSSFGIFKTFSGGLYDVALSIGTPVASGADVFLRLRLLGGGARVDRRSLDNWANLFFATAGVRGDVMTLLERD